MNGHKVSVQPPSFLLCKTCSPNLSPAPGLAASGNGAPTGREGVLSSQSERLHAPASPVLLEQKREKRQEDPVPPAGALISKPAEAIHPTSAGCHPTSPRCCPWAPTYLYLGAQLQLCHLKARGSVFYFLVPDQQGVGAQRTVPDAAPRS